MRTALFLLDRDGVVIPNRPTNVKTPADLELLRFTTGRTSPASRPRPGHRERD
jgi:hypothetical protein